VRHINLRLTEQLQREEHLLAIRVEERLLAINRPDKKKVNALLIICRTVGCAEDTVRIIGNNAEEIKECAKSGNKDISCLRMFVYGMYRKDVDYVGRG